MWLIFKMFKTLGYRKSRISTLGGISLVLWKTWEAKYGWEISETCGVQSTSYPNNNTWFKPDVHLSYSLAKILNSNY